MPTDQELAVTIAIPVGPERKYSRWLHECLSSVLLLEGEHINIVLIDDMAGVREHEPWVWNWARSMNIEHDYRLELCEMRADDMAPYREVFLFEMPWKSGVVGGFNAAFGLQLNPWVFMLGADDTVEPNMVTEWRKAVNGWAERGHDVEMTYWGVPLRYMDTGEEQNLPCNAAFAHKELWRHTGGFPPECAVGAVDTMFISMMMAKGSSATGHILMVGDRPLYNYRRHGETDTAQRADWQGVVGSVRKLITERPFKPADWGRYE